MGSSHQTAEFQDLGSLREKCRKLAWDDTSRTAAT
jgi:hypothetical protein